MLKEKKISNWMVVLIIVAVVGVIGIVAKVMMAPDLMMKQEVYTLEYGEELPRDVTAYAAFFSEEDEKEAVLDLSGVTPEYRGSYLAGIILNKKWHSFKIDVVDTIAPEYVLKEESIVADLGETLYASWLFEKITDASYVSVGFKDADGNIEKDYICSEAGESEVTVRIADEAGNETNVVLDLTVVIPDETAPVLSGVKDITVYVGNTPDYLEGVTAEDETDGDLTDKIVVDTAKVDVNKKGAYPVSYSCTDEAGNEVVESIFLTVKRKEAQTTAKNEVPQTSEQNPQKVPETTPQQQPKPETPKQETPKNEESKPQSKPETPKEESKPALQPPQEDTPPDQLDMSQIDRGEGMTPEEFDDWVSNSDVGKN